MQSNKMISANSNVLYQDFKIKKHQLTHDSSPVGLLNSDILQPVPQISGRGEAVSPPRDRPIVINNVVKPFRGGSEEDRRRATNIMDFIIQKKKAVERTKERQRAARESKAEQELVKDFDDQDISDATSSENDPKFGTNNQSKSEFKNAVHDTTGLNDSFTGVSQKDMDRLTGGMQTVKESYVNLDGIDRMA